MAADQPRLADPPREGLAASTSTACSRRSSRVKAGYEEAILLDDHGHVCEGTGENVYIVRDGVIATPGQHNSILDGIMRRSIMQIARDLGYTVEERNVARAEMYLADEVFLSGTAAELVPVREVDDHKVGTGKPGEITRVLQARLRRRHPRAHRALPRVARRRQPPPGDRGEAPAAAEQLTARSEYRGDRPSGAPQPARRRDPSTRGPRAPDAPTYSSTTPPCATAWAAAA